MAILYKKPRKFAGAGKTDNINYLMQNTDKGSKKRTPEEMQVIADEMDRQAGITGTRTETKVWPEGKPFNKEYMDPTDAVVSLGGRASQEPFITKHFPLDKSAIGGWQYKKDPGVSTPMKAAGDPVKSKEGIWETTYVPGRWGVVDEASSAQTIHAAKQGGNTLNQTLAYLLGHEVGHGWIETRKKGSHHLATGLMERGDESMKNLYAGKTIDYLLSPALNKSYKDYIIKHRQYNIKTGVSDPKIDVDRLASDNYDINKAKFEAAEAERERLAAEKQERMMTLWKD